MKRIRYLLAALALPFAALLTHAAVTGQSPVTEGTGVASSVETWTRSRWFLVSESSM